MLQIQRHKIDGIPGWVAPERDIEDAWDFERIAAERVQLRNAWAKREAEAAELRQRADELEETDAREAAALRDRAAKLEQLKIHVLDRYYGGESRFQLDAPLAMTLDEHVERTPRSYMRAGGRPTVFQLRQLNAVQLAEIATLLLDPSTERLAFVRAAKLGVKAIVNAPPGLAWEDDPREPGTLAMSVIDQLAPMGTLGSLLNRLGAAVLSLNRPLTADEGKP